MKQELDKTDFTSDVFEKDGRWWARVEAKYEDEGELGSGGYFYKKSFSTRTRAFENEEEARVWRKRALQRMQFAIEKSR